MTSRNTPSRPPLTRERVLGAAIDLADRRGLDSLTMRNLGAELGVEAMSLYKHIANKDEILDGMLEVVIGEIEIPAADHQWRDAMRRRAISAREVLGRHSWSIGMLETRGATGPTTMRYLDAILGNLRSADFSIENATHALWLLDSYVYGHVVQETNMPLANSEEVLAADSSDLKITVEDFPNLLEAEQHAIKSGYSFDSEFEFGLDLILDGLERLLEEPQRD